ncbi:tetratricopeptide repeat protein, partial [Bacteroides salyersiae]|uniref:tetratricopeptide repeat protein n=1 Tax=Bacteroides salyersiae TaxID=291644 RepID=UPI0034A28DAE
MNKELYHKIIMLGCLLLLITSSIGTNNDPLLPEDYAKIVQEHFANEEWEEGKTLLEEGLGRYPKVSDLQWLMGKYWHHKKDYDQARYHLIKAIEDNYNNVNAKQLLVDVEENTQNYSSAICYVNELLEVNPYWRGLWRRKIDLYRKQGNDVEADRLLKRINQIYPNDTILRKDYIYSMELGYQHMKKSGNRKEAINTLTELIKAAPGNEQYYLDIINLQLQEGNQEAALGWASNGLSEIPGSYSLISKKVGILGELARYPEALVFMRDQMRKNNSAALRQLYNHILLEAAQAERQRDPYVLYGIVYDNGKNNKEALDYLLNTSVTRGYSDDAFYYLREAKKKYGDTDKGILYKEYLLYRKMNEKDRAFSTLNKLYELYPDDYDILLAICEQHMEKAERLIELGLHAEALPHTQFIIQKQVDSEITGIAWERALGCYISMKKYNEALAALDTLTTRYPEYENGIWKRAFILDKMDKTAEALDIYLSAIEHSDENMRMFYVIGYEELAIPYIKKCMEAGNTQRAHDTACKLVQLNPSSDLGLRYAINTSALLKQYDKFQQYTEQGLQYYPNEPFYQTKLATIYDRDKQYDLSIGLLHPIVQKYPDNKEVIGAFSQSSEYRALQLSKSRKAVEAIAVLDTAIQFDSQNKSLKYTKGLVYENNKQADSAYYYQKYYEPSLMEYKSFQRHLNGLKSQMLKNEIALIYLRARYGEEDIITSVASLEYTRKARKNTYTGRINYAGRSGSANKDMTAEEQTPGGVGIQIQGEWTHRFSSTVSGMANVAYATQYFPQIAANIAVTKYFKNDWELDIHAGYRRTTAFKKSFRFNENALNEETGHNGIRQFGIRICLEKFQLPSLFNAHGQC